MKHGVFGQTIYVVPVYGLVVVFICFDKIVVEIKAVFNVADEHRAQVHNYLKATGHKLELLVNFGHYPKVEWERIVRERKQ